jgi:glyoxylase-like metal-dependent hydrolase (beta-lactamase superfamily II)/ferredoxin
MANPSKRVPENVPGDFFVDSTCIDCDACRQIAPSVFGEAADTSFVRHQPETPFDRRDALRALLACPTGSIGCLGDENLKDVMGDFPLEVESPVYYCGYNSPKSFGGNSYFVRHDDGNWLIDSPKFLSPLVKRLEELGGVDCIFLTHRDDVADADKYAHHFGAERIIDLRELDAVPHAEIVLEGDEPTALGEQFLAIPTPGHSEGHCCLLYANRFLFTGDHLAWNRDRIELTAFRDYCWFSWDVQRESMKRLAQHSFEWVLPGHGQRIRLPAEEMSHQMTSLIERMSVR